MAAEASYEVKHMMSAHRTFSLTLLLLAVLYLYVGSASARPIDIFHVRNYPDILQGMSLAALKNVVGKLNNNCPQRLERSADNPSIYKIYICDEPQIYLSFCNDRLYWASTFLRGGFFKFVREIKTFKSNKAMAAFLDVKDVTVDTRAVVDGAVVSENQLSVHLERDEYTLIMTLFGAPPGKLGVESEIRMNFQAKLDTSTCK